MKMAILMAILMSGCVLYYRDIKKQLKILKIDFSINWLC